MIVLYFLGYFYRNKQNSYAALISDLPVFNIPKVNNILQLYFFLLLNIKIYRYLISLEVNNILQLYFFSYLYQIVTEWSTSTMGTVNHVLAV